MMPCKVYRSEKKAETYLYLADHLPFDELPEELRQQFGEATFVLSLELSAERQLARVDVTHTEPGTKIEVGQLDGQQKRLKATVCAFPHFDPKKERTYSITNEKEVKKGLVLIG